MIQRLGPDNIVSLMAATIYGSTETTFYVAAVYFGSVGIKQTRHAIPAGLLADLGGRHRFSHHLPRGFLEPQTLPLPLPLRLPHSLS